MILVKSGGDYLSSGFFATEPNQQHIQVSLLSAEN
jgi:hypothetical protein